SFAGSSPRVEADPKASPDGPHALNHDPEPRPATVASRIAQIALYIAAWAFVAFFFASQNWLSALYAGRSTSFRVALIYPVTDAALWAVLGIGVIALSRRFPLDRGRVLRGLAVHLPVALVVSLVEGAASFTVFRSLGMFAGSTRPPAQLMSLM